MTSLDDLLRQHGGLTTVHVERWVARGLLKPAGDATAHGNSEIKARTETKT